MSTDVRDPESAARTHRLRTGTLIGYYCVAHHVPSTKRSPITVYRRTWAFCVSGCMFGHEWAPITPVSIEQLHLFGPRFLPATPEPTPA